MNGYSQISWMFDVEILYIMLKCELYKILTQSSVCIFRFAFAR